MKLIVCKKEKIESLAAAEIIKLVNENPLATLGLATGSSPLGLYQLLINDHKENKTDYSKVKTFNLDEYLGLPDDHYESYKNFMRRNLFDHININLDNTFFPHPEDPEGYSELLHHSKIDLQILGIGSNGHIGFNEPGTPFESKTHIVALAEQTRLDNARFFDSIDDVPTHAVSMGLDDIIQAKKIILLAFGKSKANAIKELVQGEPSTDCPATILQRHPNVTLYVDEDAASLL